MKRKIALLLSVLMLTGCGNLTQKDVPDSGSAGIVTEGMDGSGTSGSVSPGTEEISWRAAYNAMENRYYRVAVAGDAIYGCRQENSQVAVDYLERESLSVQKCFPLPDVFYVQSMAADGQGNVYLLENKGGDTVFWKLDREGDLQENPEITLEDTENAVFIEPRGVYADGRGHLYFHYRMSVPETEIPDREPNKDGIPNVYVDVDRIYVMDEQLNTLFYEQFLDTWETGLLSLQVSESEAPLLVVRDQEGIYVQEIDVEGKSLGEPVRQEDPASLSGGNSNLQMNHIAAVEGGFLFCLGSALYEYSFDTQRTEKLLNFLSFGIYTSDILYLGKSGEVIEIIDNHGDSTTELVSLEIGESEKVVLTLGVMELLQGLEAAVAEYNRYQQGVQIQIVEYYKDRSAQDGYERGSNQLTLDIVTGKAPDILDVSSVDYDVFAEKGVLADLYGFMQEDVDCSKDMLISSVIEAHETNGSLYCISPSFLLWTMWGARSVTGGRTGVTLEEMIQILQENGRGVSAIDGFAADEPALKTLCTFGMDEFVDWDNKTCEFDGEYFKSILRFVKDYKGGYPSGSRIESIRNKEILLTNGTISSVATYQLEKEIYGEEIGFIGYPTAEGSGTAVNFMGAKLAIASASKKQQEAWDFVKYYLQNGYDGQGFPLVKEQFNQVMARAMEEEYVTEDGVRSRVIKGSYWVGDGSIYVFAATQEDVDAVVQLVESASNRYRYHIELQNIIDEEVGGYLSGQRDLDEVVKVIQNKASLYLQE
ncbi:MAG: extracellular solute-binding protein [Acetatifactor sp.]|nr:extracellular solute-binding protein [Acetatifactor sp.]